MNVISSKCSSTNKEKQRKQNSVRKLVRSFFFILNNEEGSIKAARFADTYSLRRIKVVRDALRNTS